MLAFKLAWELAPASADLRIVSNTCDAGWSTRDDATRYCTVHDVRNNVVYDLGRDVYDKPAAFSLGHARGEVRQQRWPTRP